MTTPTPPESWLVIVGTSLLAFVVGGIAVTAASELLPRLPELAGIIAIFIGFAIWQKGEFPALSAVLGVLAGPSVWVLIAAWLK